MTNGTSGTSRFVNLTVSDWEKLSDELAETPEYRLADYYNIPPTDPRIEVMSEDYKALLLLALGRKDVREKNRKATAKKNNAIRQTKVNESTTITEVETSDENIEAVLAFLQNGGTLDDIDIIDDPDNELAQLEEVEENDPEALLAMAELLGIVQATDTKGE